MKLLSFLNEHYNDWEDILCNPPYALKLNKCDKYILFKYDMLESDMKLDICREARGCIFYDNGKEFELVCYPFDKFFNYDEPNNDIEPDWSTASVQEKVDGSLIKVWYHNGDWRISTNGTVDAFNAEAFNNVSFGALFCSVIDINMFYHLDKDYTYMFELVSPFTQIVVEYAETAIYYLGRRSNATLTEERFNEGLAMFGIKTPKVYPLTSVDECKTAAAAMGDDEEGFVVCDSAFRRVKIKSPAYVAAHHLIGNNKVSAKNILEMYREEVLDDFLAIKKSYIPFAEEILAKYHHLISDMDNELSKFDLCLDEKDFAKSVIGNKYSDFLFKAYRKGISAKLYIEKKTVKQIMKLLGEEDE